MSKDTCYDLAKQFKQYLKTGSVEEIKKAVKIGSEALLNGTLDTNEYGVDLFYQLIRIEQARDTDEKVINDLFEMLILTGASQRINGLDSFHGDTAFDGDTALMNSIAFNTPIMFDLLMSCPSIDLNVCGRTPEQSAYNTNWTALVTAVFYQRSEMVQTLCKRFYEVDFNIVATVGGVSHTALTYAANYRPRTIRTLIETAINVDLPRYKHFVSHLLLSHFPKVLIPIIGLYAFF